jgi:DNA modification methylase
MKIINGDSLEELKKLPDNSVDSIVTDPPYELGFMGKKWDNTGIAYNVLLWTECLRVLKPGGHLLAFGGSRTYHRMACAIEDAGFEIRDMISENFSGQDKFQMLFESFTKEQKNMFEDIFGGLGMLDWVYGSGFPKSFNVGKAVDDILGNEREFLGSLARSGRRGGILGKEVKILKEYTKGSSDFEGFGTALKPAHEPIVMARKPLSEKTVAENVLKWGTGAINIDGCRIGTEERINPQAGFIRRGRTDEEIFSKVDKNKPDGNILTQGRFPSNFIHDGSDDVLWLFPECKSGKERPAGIGNGESIFAGKNRIGFNIGDSGSAARFFYCAKASKSERNYGLDGLEKKEVSHDGRKEFNENPYQRHENIQQNHHPTVKPIKLMRYLVRLVTPPNGTVLDPFGGSGTTGVACKLEGFDFILIEKETEYIPIIEGRINHISTQKGEIEHG